MPTSPQIWRLTVAGRAHRVEADLGFTRRVRWYVDDELVDEKKSIDEKFKLDGPAGKLKVRFSTLGAPRRATLVPAGAGVEELDLVPAPDSTAAAHEDKVRAHPERFAAIQTVGGVARVIVPIVLTTLVVRFAVTLPWPSWDIPFPTVPTPDLPSPDLPSIPWPDLPDVSLPGWLSWILENIHYIWPVVLAFVLARVEIRRRRQQDARRDQSREE